MWILFSTSAFAQQIPDGDLEGSTVEWYIVDGSQDNIVVLWSDLLSTWVLNINRVTSHQVACSARFVVTSTTLSAVMHDPYDTSGGSDWWLEDDTGHHLVDGSTDPSPIDYSAHDLDITDACGQSVVVCLEPDQHTQIDYDDLAIGGDPCPDFADTDGDGYCPEGVDLDGGGCTGEGEFDAPISDCDDTDGTVFPGQIETCDHLDDDCNGQIDEGFDQDTDGFTSCGGDCDDDQVEVHPGVVEVCDTVDQDCNGVVDDGFDLDLDGWTSCGGDCDDADPRVLPGGKERCNGADDDCDGRIDDGIQEKWWPDLDHDGFGDGEAHPDRSCDPIAGSADNGDDCDDGDPQVHPGAIDQDGDGLDQDCDGQDAAAPENGTGPVDGPPTLVDRDPAAVAAAVGCGCDGGGPGAGGALVVILGLLARRRR